MHEWGERKKCIIKDYKAPNPLYESIKADKNLSLLECDTFLFNEVDQEAWKLVLICDEDLKHEILQHDCQ